MVKTNTKDLMATPEAAKVVNRLIAEKSLLDFVKQAWPILEPKTKFSDNWHLEYLEEELLLLVIDDVWEVLDLDKEYAKQLSENVFNNRVNINIPPRTMKSLFINVFFPCWVWIHNPSKRFIVVSYSNDLSMDLNKKRRELISSDWYQENWGHIVKLKDEQNTKTSFENTQQGAMFSTSVGGTLTGKGGDVIILDDLQNPKQAESEADRKAAILFVTNTLPTRLNDFVKSVIVNVQQRLHYNDVSGFIQSNYDFYKTIVLPVETAENRYYVGPISGKTYMYEAGTVLWPTRMPLQWIERTRKEQGAKTYNAQFLQDPTPPGGNLINPEWFRRWKRLPIYNPDIMKARGDKYRLVQSWDMAFKEKVDTDNVACSVFLTDGVTTYLVDKFEEQIGFIKSLEAVTRMREKWLDIFRDVDVRIPIEVIIEEKANGAAIIEVLCTTIPGIIPIIPTEDKLSRMTSITPFIEAGNVLIPDVEQMAILQEHPWVPDVVTELSKFPHIKRKDFSDAFSMGLRRIYVDTQKKRKRMAIY